MAQTKGKGPLDITSRLGIPAPTSEPDSLRSSVMALRSAVEEVTRQRGDMANSAVTVRDIVKLGLVAPETIRVLDPGGAYYVMDGLAGMDVPYATDIINNVPPADNEVNLDDLGLDILAKFDYWDTFGGLIDANTALINQEIADRWAQVYALEQQVQANLDATIAYSTALQNQVNQTASDILQEVADRQADVTNLQAQILDNANTIQFSIFYQPEPPVPGVAGVPDPIPTGARWYDTDDGNHPYYWDGVQWQDLQDGDIGQNAADITALGVSLTTAEGNITANANAISTLDTTVTNLNGVVTANSAAITTLQSDLSTAEGNISANATAISGLDTRVTTAEGNITANASDITILQTSLSTAEGNITANSTAISGLDSRVTTAEGNITANASDITLLQTDLSTAEGNITANATALSGLTTTVSSIQGTVDAHSQQLVSLEANLENLELIGLLDTAVSSNASALQALDARVTYGEGELTAMASDISALQVTVEAIEGGEVALGAIQALDARVTINEAGIAANTSSITILQADVTSLDNSTALNAGAISSLETRMTSAEGVNTAQSSDITSLQSGLTTTNGNVAANASALSALDTRVTSAEGTITVQSGQITTLQADLSTAEGDIIANGSAISSLDTRVTSAEGTITTHTSQILALQSSTGIKTFRQATPPTAQAIGDLWIDTDDGNKLYYWDGAQWLLSQDTAITGNASAISSLDTRVTTAEGNISTNASDITTLDASLTTAQGNIAANASAVSALDTRVTSAEGTITSHSSQITALQSKAVITTFRQTTPPTAQNTGDLWIETDNNNKLWRWNGTSWVDSDNTTIGANASAISALDTRVTTAEGNITASANDITSLQSSLTTTNNNVTGNATAISALDTRVTDAEGDITAQASQISSLTTTVGGHTTSISTLTSTTNGLEAQYTIKVDNNGYVAGFGLASTPVNGVPLSTFAVLADEFYIAHPGGSVAPFAVSGGVVYMQNTVIGAALIDNLSVNNITVGGNLDVDVTQNGDWFLGTGRIVFDNGTHIKAQGIGFGSSSQFMEWFGPRPTGGNLALCTEANAIMYIKTNGDAYYGGALSVGVLKNAAQTTSLSSTAYVEVGPFGTNGNPKDVTVSYTASAPSFFNSTDITGSAGTVSLKLERKIGGGAYSQVATGTANGNYVCFPNEIGGATPPYTCTCNASGSFTYGDNNTSTSNFSYKASITARSLGFNLTLNQQSLSVVSIEE